MTLLTVLLPLGAAAHHSISPFDTGSSQEVEGTVERVSWRNPHIRLTLRVDGEAWEIEGDSANAAARRGLTAESVQVGDVVRIAGWPSTLGRNEIFMTNVLIDGTETIVSDLDRPLLWTQPAQAATASAAGERTLFRVWSSSGELYRLRNPYVLTPAAEANRAGWDPYTDIPALRCQAPGMPNAILNPYPIEFVARGDEIELRIEEWEAVRIIHMTLRSIPEDAPATRLGYSVGRWEDDSTLVVETARIDYPYLDDAGTPMSEQVRIVERFTLSSDGTRLAQEMTVTDPQNLVEPAIWDVSRQWIPGTVVRPYECDPE